MGGGRLNFPFLPLTFCLVCQRQWGSSWLAAPFAPLPFSPYPSFLGLEEGLNKGRQEEETTPVKTFSPSACLP